MEPGEEDGKKLFGIDRGEVEDGTCVLYWDVGAEI